MTRWTGILLLLCGTALPLEAQEESGDRHAARREWLARRRAGALADSVEARVPGGAGEGRSEAPSRGRTASPGTPTSPAAEAAAPHRFAQRFQPNYQVPARTPELWPLEPLWGGYGYGYGMGAHSWYSSGPQGWGSAHTCARVTLTMLPGGRYSLFMMLPPAAPYDVEELELLLDRQLSAGQSVQLQSADGGWVRVRPGARIEAMQISPCRN